MATRWRPTARSLTCDGCPTGSRRARTARRSTIERLVQRLGATAIPLLGRELRSTDARRREASRSCARGSRGDDAIRARVIAELRAITDSDVGGDEIKVCALGLLAELGERGAARFSDPSAIQHRSAIALATQIGSEADVASAADLMVRQLDEDDMVQMLEVMVEAAPTAAHRLADRAVAPPRSPGRSARADRRLDDRRCAASPASLPVERRRASRPTQVAVLVDASARLVVVASKKVDSASAAGAAGPC